MTDQHVSELLLLKRPSLKKKEGRGVELKTGNVCPAYGLRLRN